MVAQRANVVRADHPNHRHAITQVSRMLGGHGCQRIPPPEINTMLPHVRYITCRVVSRHFVQVAPGESLACSLTPLNSLGPGCITQTGATTDSNSSGFFSQMDANTNNGYFPTTQMLLESGHMRPIGGRGIMSVSGSGAHGDRILVQPATGKLTVLSTTSSLGSYITAAAGANEYPLVLGSNSVTSITGMKDGVIMVEAGEGDRAIVFQPQALANNNLASFNEVFSQLKTEHHQGTGAVYHHVHSV